MTLSRDERKAMRERIRQYRESQEYGDSEEERLDPPTFSVSSIEQILIDLDAAERERDEALAAMSADVADVVLAKVLAEQRAEQTEQLAQRLAEKDRQAYITLEAHLVEAVRLLKRATEFVALVYRQGGDAGMENSGGLLDEVHAFLSVAPADSLEEKS